MRRFAISENGAEHLVNELPSTTSFRCARLAFLVLLAVAAVSVGDLVLRTRGGEDVGRLWLGPAGYVAVAFLIAAAFFGVHARLPASSPYYGEWVGLPGPIEADASGHTMPGLVKAEPGFCGFWLFICVWGGLGLGHETDMPNPFGALLGVVTGVTVWWAIMLCFSRGWVKEGD